MSELISITTLANELGYSVKAGRLRQLCRELEIGRVLKGYYLTKGEVRTLKREIDRRGSKRPRGPEE